MKASIIDIVLKTAGIEKEELFPDGLFVKKVLTQAFNNAHLLSRIVRPIRSIESWYENYGKFVVEQLNFTQEHSMDVYSGYSGTAKIRSSKEDWELEVKWSITRLPWAMVLVADTIDALKHKAHFEYNIMSGVLLNFSEQGGIRFKRL